MRLTLRTLLAYLDDILEAPEAKELGAKINESETARQLVERIRDVMRRRRLTAPDIEGPGSGLDPNTVAEYLDNTLSPQAIADVEKVCLESDLQLAEVAACHQILTLVLGEPVQVAPESRERLYALIPKPRPAEPVPPPIPGTDAVGHNGASPPPLAAATVPGGGAEAIPDYLRPTPLWRRVLPYAALVLLAGSWLGLLAYDPTLFGLGGEGPAPPPDERVAANDNAGPPADVPAADRPIAAAPEREPGDDAPQDMGPMPAPEPMGDDMPVADAGPQPADVPQDAAPMPQDGAGQPMANAVAANNVPQPMPNPPAPQPEPPVQPAVPVVYTSREGILLNYDPNPNASGWFSTPFGRAIQPGTFVASPEPFHAIFSVGEQGTPATVHLAGGTAVRWLGPSEFGPFGVEIHRGGVGVQTPPADAAAAADAQQGMGMLVAVGGELFRVTAAPESLFGIEVEPKQPEGFQKIPGRGWHRGALNVARGRVTIADQAGWSQTLEGQSWLSLTPEDRAGMADPALAAPQPLAVLPGWIDLEANPPSFATRQLGIQFERKFDKDRELLLSVPAIAKDARPQVAEVAVKCLAVTESVAALVDALAYEALPDEARRAAIVGLRQWLARHPEQAQELKGLLERSFRADTAGAVYELLWGFNEQDGRDAVISQRLVAWLEHPHIVVRELAIAQLYRLTDLKFDYRPNDPEGRRRTAVNKWRAHLDRRGTLVTKEAP